MKLNYQDNWDKKTFKYNDRRVGRNSEKWRCTNKKNKLEKLEEHGRIIIYYEEMREDVVIYAHILTVHWFYNWLIYTVR